MCKIKEFEKQELEIERTKLLNSNFDELCYDLKKKYVKYYHDSKCVSCGLSEWLGQPITIEIDHIDGDNKNNLFENLRPLCPNCHAMTDTWRGKNKNNKRLKVSNAELLKELLDNDWNMYKALTNVGLAPKGGNYKRCHTIKDQYLLLGYIDEIKVSIDIDQTTYVEAFYKSNNITEIANLLNISYKRAYAYSKQYNCVFSGEEYDIDEIIKLLKELRSFKAVGRVYNVTDNSIRKRLIKHNYDPKTIIKR